MKTALLFFQYLFLSSFFLFVLKTPSDAQTTDELVEKIRSGYFNERQEAIEKLRKRGPEARKALVEALQKEFSKEQPETEELIVLYKRGSKKDKEGAIRTALLKGEPAIDELFKRIIRAENEITKLKRSHASSRSQKTKKVKRVRKESPSIKLPRPEEFSRLIDSEWRGVASGKETVRVKFNKGGGLTYKLSSGESFSGEWELDEVLLLIKVNTAKSFIKFSGVVGEKVIRGKSWEKPLSQTEEEKVSDWEFTPIR